MYSNYQLQKADKRHHFKGLLSRVCPTAVCHTLPLVTHVLFLSQSPAKPVPAPRSGMMTTASGDKLTFSDKCKFFEKEIEDQTTIKPKEGQYGGHWVTHKEAVTVSNCYSIQ